MKNIVVLNGSPRSNGFTQDLIKAFTENVDEKNNVEIIDCGKLNINFCIDCRYCEKNFKCSVNDDMQDIYVKLENADVIIFATPVYFYSISAQLKTVIDRLQVYFYRHIKGINKDLKDKIGILISVGGAKAYENQFFGVETIAKGAMNDLNCRLEKTFYLSATDKVDVTSLQDIKLSIVNYAKTV